MLSRVPAEYILIIASGKYTRRASSRRQPDRSWGGRAALSARCPVQPILASTAAEESPEYNSRDQRDILLCDLLCDLNPM